MRRCAKCDEVKAEASFRKGQNGGTRHTCRKCESELRMLNAKSNPERTRRQHQKRDQLISQMRHDGVDVPRWILIDSKRVDKRRGVQHDLDVGWITDQISKGCSYCGVTTLRMTIDRIDNSLGHLKTNCLPACIRCNYLKRDMPHAAWMELVPTVKLVVQTGLFGTWTGRARTPKITTTRT